ncbi:MAG: IS21 family transposase [Gammaproteobacteria bacterium]
MANKLLQMMSIKQTLRRLHQGESQNKIAKELGVHKRSIRSYKTLFESEGYSLEQALALPEEKFVSLINEHKPRETTHTGKRVVVLEANREYYLRELERTGVTAKLLWEEYLQQHSSGYGYSQFAFHISRFQQEKKLSMPQDHRAGEFLELDFAGEGLHYIDEETGEKIKVEVLVATLPFSGYSLALALPSQKQSDFVSGVNWMIKQLGVLPQALKTDNLKSGVIKSDRYEPTFNVLLSQLAEHYGMVLKAARPGKPKDKPHVENSVSQVYRNVHARIRNEEFFSLKALNLAMVEQMKRMNQTFFQGREYSRLDMFEEERKQMRSLPDASFEVICQRSAKVQNDYHIFLGMDKHKYSVPYQYYKQQVSVQFTQTLVRIYNSKNECIATHERVRSAHKHSTHKEHMPPHHKDYHDHLQWSGQHYVNEAQKIGSFTKMYMEKLLKSKPYEQLSYDSCKGLLSLKRNFTPEDIESACSEYASLNIASYKPVRNLLEKWRNETSGKGEVLMPAAPTTITSFTHNNLR